MQAYNIIILADIITISLTVTPYEFNPSHFLSLSIRSTDGIIIYKVVKMPFSDAYVRST